MPAARVRTQRPAPRGGRSRSVPGAEERGEPRGQRPRPEGGEVVVEVAVRGHEDDGGEAAGRERSSGGQCGDGGEEGEHGLDALADQQGGAGSPGRPEAHGVAVDAPQRLAGLGDRGLGGALGMEPGALHAFEGAVRAGDGSDEGGEAAPARGVAVGERGMEAQRREAAVPQAAGAFVLSGRSSTVRSPVLTKRLSVTSSSTRATTTSLSRAAGRASTATIVPAPIPSLFMLSPSTFTK